jgi:hypothetical protein
MDNNSCKFITKPKRNIQIGDLNIPIQIITRIKKANNTNTQDVLIDQENLIANTWALQISVNGEDVFNGTNILGKVTDHFYIRRDSSKIIKLENMVICKGEAYKILEVMPNLHGENIFAMLKCSHNGSVNVNLNII